MTLVNIKHAGGLQVLKCLIILFFFVSLNFQVGWADDRVCSPEDRNVSESTVAGGGNSAIQSSNQTREELYPEDCETEPPQLTTDIYVSLIVNGSNKGKIKITFSEDRSDIYFSGSPVLAALSDILKPDIIKGLEGKIDSEGRITKRLLEESGIPTAFNNKKLQLSITVPQELRVTQTREELYLKVFNTAPPKLPTDIYASLIVNDNNEGKIKITFSEDRSDIYFPGSPVLTALSDILKPDILKNIEGKIDSEGMLTRRLLEESGIPTAFNANRFQLLITVPQELRGARILRLSGKKVDPYTIDAIAPNPFSGYLNFSAKEVFKYPQQDAFNSTRQPLGVNFNGALNWNGWVLEESAFYHESSVTTLRRNDIRLVFDRPKKALRYTAGDLRYPTVGYQSVVNIGGIGISKDFSLQPHINAYPVSEFEFFLEHPAEVEVWVNGTLARTMQLNPGRHDIRGFPYSNGENDVEIKITDISGREQILRFSFIHEPMLLAQGKRQFSYNLGLRRRIEDVDYIYDIKDPILSLFYRRGINNLLTLGGYSQASSHQALVGIEGIRALPVGKLQFDTAVSAIEGIGADLAAKLSFIHLSKPPQTRSGLRWRADAEYLGHRFGRINNSSPQNSEVMKLSSSVSFPLGNAFYAGIGGRHTIMRGHDLPDTFSLSARLRRTWMKHLNTNIIVQHSRDRSGGTATDVLVGMFWSFFSENHGFMVNKTTDRDLELRWDNRNSSSLPGKARNSATAKFGSERNEYRVNMGYTSNQGFAELSHRTIEPHNQKNQSLQHQTSITLQSSLVYVDGNWAFSRPVTDGFVLVKNIKNLKNTKIAVNPGSRGYQAASSRFGPAVLNYLPSYRLKEVRVNPIDPPIGYIPQKKTNFTLFPAYKSGFALYLGTEATVIVIGSLVDENSEPIANQQIKVVSLDDSQAEPLIAFTNSKGKFQFLGIKSGRYEIRPVESGKWEPVSFEIPEDKDGVYRIGELTEKEELTAKKITSEKQLTTPVKIDTEKKIPTQPITIQTETKKKIEVIDIKPEQKVIRSGYLTIDGFGYVNTGKIEVEIIFLWKDLDNRDLGIAAKVKHGDKVKFIQQEGFRVLVETKDGKQGWVLYVFIKELKDLRSTVKIIKK